MTCRRRRVISSNFDSTSGSKPDDNVDGQQDHSCGLVYERHLHCQLVKEGPSI